MLQYRSAKQQGWYTAKYVRRTDRFSLENTNYFRCKRKKKKKQIVSTAVNRTSDE